jgi:hypothetical protein
MYHFGGRYVQYSMCNYYQFNIIHLRESKIYSFFSLLFMNTRDTLRLALHYRQYPNDRAVGHVHFALAYVFTYLLVKSTNLIEDILESGAGVPPRRQDQSTIGKCQIYHLVFE